ncbi:DET1- and DDB1-associated protein 1-like [Metopolophium dirhodum]|uniref:DET1- and DDB1-associated protein 1-like n=1 Tax=Metopolophium dirhodum TaxID=44670 RepID=UPI002990370C|nr:DET1- and DDB1-associated protein 1-like [Metopolophium dirhodum]
MSIAEFLDGLPSYDERNFSSFTSKSCGNKSSLVYITTKDQPSEQIVNDYSNLSFQDLPILWDLENRCNALDETSEESDTLDETSEESDALGETSDESDTLDETSEESDN